MAYPIEERETVLVYSDESKQWTVYSNVPKHLRKLNELTELTILESEDERIIAAKGLLNEKQVSMKKLRVISEETRQKLSNNMKKITSR